MSLPFRIGHGYDLHRLEPVQPAGPGRPFVLAGVRFDHDRGPVGHSDGDAAYHAVTDAILGAAGLPDIGQLFPDTDPRWDGTDSAVFLTEAVERVAREGWHVANVDVTIVCERPKLGPRKPELVANLARLLRCAPSQVNVKGKTHERVDAVGEGRAVEVHAVALLSRVEAGPAPRLGESCSAATAGSASDEGSAPARAGDARRDYEAVARAMRREGDRTARMEMVVEALWKALSGAGVSWVGFYLDQPGSPDDQRLVLGPRRPGPACSPIGLHGVCGQALRQRAVRIVADVAELGPDYIACDPRDRSEIVLPLTDESGRCWGVLDLDSHELAAFDQRDAEGLRRVLRAAGL